MLLFSSNLNSRMVVMFLLRGMSAGKKRGTGIQGSNLGGCWCNWPIPIFADGRILTVAGVTIAIYSAPFIGLLILVALAVWPDWLVVATCETLRKVFSFAIQFAVLCTVFLSVLSF
ncbi:uncharacterized protein LOC107623613 isoform X1 [Arachis ipaensis]|uniref:uncharacterized protein LOC107623613 isoform X1 n=1 Tax=Arachis ipaensis TaxID=130454 RepID=UPI000A2B50FB|nr:uncharacterized protein LOC107623613 isoform X1 [Arachis ipaensis]